MAKFDVFDFGNLVGRGPAQLVAAGLAVGGLVMKFGTFLVEEMVQGAFEEVVSSLSIAGENQMGIADYDFVSTSMISDIGVGFTVLGLGSAAMCLLGVAAGKAGVLPIAILYCVLLVLVLLTQIVIAMIITIKRPLIDDMIKPALKDSLKQGYNGFNGTDSTTQTWNLVMFTMKCCGSESYLDFTTSAIWNRRLFQDGWWFNLSTPLLCCNFDVKVAGDYSCAVNPTSATSFYDKGCYNVVWEGLVDNKMYAIMAGMVFFIAQLAVLGSAIVHSRTLCSKGQCTKGEGDDDDDHDDETGGTKHTKPNGIKSIADLISSTAGILSQTSNPDVPPDVRNLMDQSLNGNVFGGNLNMNGAGGYPQFGMPFIFNNGRSMNTLHQLLQQYQQQGRFASQSDMFNPLNMFTAAFMNPFAGVRGDNTIHMEDLTNGLIQQMQMSNCGNASIVPYSNRNPHLLQLTRGRSLKDLPVLELGSPVNVRRGSVEQVTCSCDLTHDESSTAKTSECYNCDGMKED